MMRRGRILLLFPLLAPLLALPTAAGARSIPLVGIVTAPLQMVAPGVIGRRGVYRTRYHRKAAAVRRHKQVAARAGRYRGAETTGIVVAGGQGAGAPAETSAWAGPLYWPSASADLFDYALRPASAGERFWSHGARDLSAAIFLRPDAKAGVAGTCGGEPGESAWRDALAQAVAPTEAQRRALDALQSAVTAARKNIDATCPAAHATASPTRRLDAMTDRLWAMRQATVVLRAPLENFFATLTEEQRARFAGGGHEAGMACADPASAQVPWPGEEIERRVRPSAQNESLQALQMTLQGMGQFLMASCPAEPPATPLQRLGAAEKRLNAMLYAARMTGPALHGFYDSLSSEQKAAFDALELRPRTSGVPALARGAR